MPSVSVIVPAHNEERRLALTLDRLTAWARVRQSPVEIVVVDSASTDATVAVAERYVGKDTPLRIVGAPFGKGNALKAGVAAASGDLLYMCDADLSTPIGEADALLQPVLRGECDVAIGSREVPSARRIGEPAYRHLMGRLFNAVVRLLVVPGIQDTQSGFKCFRASAARPLFEQLTIGGFAFDVEVLFLARRNGLRVREIPITSTFDAGTRVRPWRDGLSMVADVLRIRLNSLLGRYAKRSAGR